MNVLAVLRVRRVSRCLPQGKHLQMISYHGLSVHLHDFIDRSTGLDAICFGCFYSRFSSGAVTEYGAAAISPISIKIRKRMIPVLSREYNTEEVVRQHVYTQHRR